MFPQGTMLAAVGLGLGTCAAVVHPLPQGHPQAPEGPGQRDRGVRDVAGLPDLGAPANQLGTTREPVSAFAQFIGFKESGGGGA